MKTGFLKAGDSAADALGPFFDQVYEGCGESGGLALTFEILLNGG